MVASDNDPSSAATATVTVSQTNDAPVIAGTAAGQAVNDNATLAPFSGVTITDADLPEQSLAVSVTLDTAAKGTFSTLNGFSSAGSGVYLFSGTAAAATTAIQGLIFDPADNRVPVGSTETTTFTIAVTDGNGGADADGSTTVISTSINDNPVAVNDSLVRVEFSDAKISIAQILSNDTDSDGGTLTVSLPSSTTANGATVAISGAWIQYSNAPNNNPDSFSYTLSDGQGGTSAATISVTTQPELSESANTISIERDGGDIVVRFYGIPELQYTVQYTESLSPPNWIDLGTVTADFDGFIEFRDTTASDLRFYRTFAQ